MEVWSGKIRLVRQRDRFYVANHAEIVKYIYEISILFYQTQKIESGKIGFVFIVEVEAGKHYVVLFEHFAERPDGADNTRRADADCAGFVANVDSQFYFSSTVSTRITRIVATIATRYMPTPTAIPMVATIQIPAAVVRPRTEPFI